MNFYGLKAYFCLVLNNIPFSEYTTVCLYTHHGRYWWLLTFSNSEWSCSKHLCADFHVGISFQLSWMNANKQSMDHTVWTDLVWLERVFHVAVLLCIPASEAQKFLLICTLFSLWWHQGLDFGTIRAVLRYLIVLICTSLMPYSVEHSL